MQLLQYAAGMERHLIGSANVESGAGAKVRGVIASGNSLKEVIERLGMLRSEQLTTVDTYKHLLLHSSKTHPVMTQMI